MESGAYPSMQWVRRRFKIAHFISGNVTISFFFFLNVLALKQLVNLSSNTLISAESISGSIFKQSGNNFRSSSVVRSRRFTSSNVIIDWMSLSLGADCQTSEEYRPGLREIRCDLLTLVEQKMN